MGCQKCQICTNFNVSTIFILKQSTHHFISILFSIWQMPEKPLWLKKLLGWFRVALFTLDTGSDVYVGVDLIQRCHYRYASGVFSFFWLPGLLSGGAVSAKFGGDYLKRKFKLDNMCCKRLILFLLGTIFGPFIFLPGGLYLLVKAALKPNDEVSCVQAKE